MQARAAERLSVLFLRPFFLRNRLPLVVLFLTNQRRPAFRLWIEPELVRQRAILKIEAKLDAEQVWIKLGMSDARVAASENIYSMTHVSFGDVLKSDEHQHFVFQYFLAGAVMQLNELVLQQPLAAHGAFNRAAVAHSAGNPPVANEIIEKRILECGRRTGSKQNSSAEQKQNQCGPRCDKHWIRFADGFPFSPGNQRI